MTQLGPEVGWYWDQAGVAMIPHQLGHSKGEPPHFLATAQVKPLAAEALQAGSSGSTGCRSLTA